MVYTRGRCLNKDNVQGNITHRGALLYIIMHSVTELSKKDELTFLVVFIKSGYSLINDNR